MKVGAKGVPGDEDLSPEMSGGVSEGASVVTVMYDGWLVWDGTYGTVAVGGELAASIEFVQGSTPRVLAPDAPLGLEHLGGNRYHVVANVLDATEAVVMDLGPFRVLRWVRPDETAGEFTKGARVALEVSLNLNGWPDSAWTTRADELYHTQHRWQVHRIVRTTAGHDDSTDVEEASTENVDSARQYCELECSLLE